MCKTLERDGERLYCRMDGSASEDEAWDGSPAPLRHSLSWKEYFGKSNFLILGWGLLLCVCLACVRMSEDSPRHIQSFNRGGSIFG